LTNQGELLSKNDLIKAVWGDTKVEPGNLDFQLSALRKALGDDGRRYIENFPKRGYRFGVPVEELSVKPSSNEFPPPPALAVPPREEPVAQPDMTPTPPIQPQRLNEGLAERSPRLWSTRSAIWATALTTAIAGTLFVVVQVTSLERPASRPRVSRIAQVSPDGAGKPTHNPLLSDGKRLFFELNGQVMSMPVDGGEPQPVNALRDFRVLDASRTRSEFLARKFKDPGAEGGLWIVPLNGSPRRFGDLTVSGDAAWSRDGRRIAYIDDRSLFVINSDGTGTTKVATVAGHPLLPRWSPDGSGVRFTVGTQADRQNQSSLWEVRANGANLHRLLAGWNEEANVCCGDWTPDGKYFVFMVDQGDRSDIWVLDEQAASKSRPDPIRLTEGDLKYDSPVPSQDGSRIFAYGRQRHGQLARLDPRTRTFAPYLGGISAFSVDFSRDRKWVIYVTQPESNLWRARIDGSDKLQLTHAPTTVDGCAWSPDGKQIAFRGGPEGGHKRIYLISQDGGLPTPLTSEDIEQGIPSWSPDGNHLTFGDVPERFGHPTGGERVHIYDVQRHTSETLPQSAGLWTARWSPNGRYISALTIEGQKIMLYDMKTARWRAVGAEHVNTPNWSRDSKYIYYDTEGPSQLIRRVRVSDGQVEDLFNLDDYHSMVFPWAGLSLDGFPIVLQGFHDAQVYALELGRN
jgi:Tol biopolymer transport system component